MSHGNSKLCADDVREIMCKRIWGWSASNLASYYNVGKSTVTDIWEGKTWKSLNLPVFQKKEVANRNHMMYDDPQWG
jgi:hypothetical protein